MMPGGMPPGVRAAWDELWASARRADMIELAERLGARLKRSGANHIGPCPCGCADKDGFVVSEKKRLFYCRPSGVGGDAIDMTMHVLGCSKVEALSYVTQRPLPGAVGWRPSPRPQPRPTPSASKGENDSELSEPRDPMEAWRNAVPWIRNSPADIYLREKRGLELTDGEAASLRFTPALRHWPSKTCWPCMVARVSLATGEDASTHMTFVDLDGSDKAPLEKPRLFAFGGKIAGAGIWFGQANPDREFIIGEGVEFDAFGDAA